LLFIIHRRQATERDDLFNAVRETMTPQKREEVDQMIHSAAQKWLEKGLEKGRKEGRKEGQIKTLLEVMTCRFGPVPEQVKKAVKALPSERIAEFTRQIMLVQSLDELHLV
jgi:flagellar biosynthesis/type III secretory pathway protein FliH